MLKKDFEIENKPTNLGSGAFRRPLAAIACVAVLAGCSSMPSFSEMGDGISQTYTDMESGVRNKYNETFNSTDQSMENEPMSAEKPVDANMGQVAMTRSAVKRLQGRLAGLAFQPGPIDGVMGLRTVRAIKRYQAAHRLPVTGKTSPQFLKHLEDTYASAKAEQMLTNSPKW